MLLIVTCKNVSVSCVIWYLPLKWVVSIAYSSVLWLVILFLLLVEQKSEIKLKSYVCVCVYSHFLMAQMVKESACNVGGFQSLGREDPLEKGWQPTPVFLPGKSCGQRILADYNTWGHKESDPTELITLYTYTHTNTHSYILVFSLQITIWK